MPIEKLLFVDTNIWLDFYRSRNEVSLSLLESIEKITNRVIVNYQLESEFKRNRQTAIIEGMQELKAPAQVSRPGMFSDAKAMSIISRNNKSTEANIKKLKSRLAKALEDPAQHDPVYQACQRIFHKSDKLALNRDNALRHVIRRKAFRRFLHGCPPRKRSDTSIGDAINWEWMVYCAREHNAELVIVSRDSDYGITWGDRSFVNDHLKQEFSERVSRKRELLLYTKLSEALKHFKVPVSAQVEEAESELVEEKAEVSIADPGWLSFINSLTNATLSQPATGAAGAAQLLESMRQRYGKRTPDQ